MKTQKMKSMSLYFPISRIDEETRIVEGIAFANEIVEGEGGIRLRASAMEAATPDYMKFGTIRSMHQPSAAGTAVPNDPAIAAQCGVTWVDEGGKRVAYLRSYISDDGDWKKVKDGTYKGYSVGVAPKVMRGKTVESCTWYETSLVDRPKDPDALLTTFRVDGMPEEVDVKVIDVDAEKVEQLRSEYVRIKAQRLPDEQKTEMLALILRGIEDAGGDVPIITRADTQTADDVPKRKDYDTIINQEDMDAACADCDEEDRAKLRSIASKNGLTTPHDWEAKDEPEPKPKSDEDAKRVIEAALKRMDWDKEARDALPDEDFGWPEEKKYPIKDQEDMDAATKLVGRAPEDKQASIKARLKAIAKRKDLKLPESWTEEKRTVTPSLVRASFAEYLEKMGQNDLRDLASRYLMYSLWDIQNGFDATGQELSTADKEKAVRYTCKQFEDFMVGVVSTGILPNVIDADNDGEERTAQPKLTRALIEAKAPDFGVAVIAPTELTRLQGLEQTVSTLTIERDEFSSELTRVQGSLVTAEGEIQRLKAMPQRVPPVRYPTAMERTFGHPVPNPQQDVIDRLRRERKLLVDTVPANPAEGETQAAQIMRLDTQLLQLGA